MLVVRCDETSPKGRDHRLHKDEQRPVSNVRDATNGTHEQVRAVHLV